MTFVDIAQDDPFVEPSEELFANPYPFYDKIRAKGKLVWSSAGEPRWISSSFDTAAAILSDQRFSVEVPIEQLSSMDEIYHGSKYRDLLAGFTSFMLAQDPPQHTRVRKLANKAFTRAEVTDMGERIGRIIDDLLDKHCPSGQMDLIADFALPLPMTVISEILGLAHSDRDKLHNWSNAIFAATEPIIKPETMEPAAQATTELFAYLKVLIAERRINPGKDLLSAFVKAEEEGDTLSIDELLANMLLLILAGHETTINLIGNGMLALIEHPQAMTKLRGEPHLIPTAVEEFLRFQSPVQITERYAKESFEFEGQSLKKGDRISIIIGGAHRDPAHFDSPNSFDILRQPNKHLAFGQGIHFCLGAPLARFEAKIAFEKLLARLKNIELAVNKVEYRPTASSRALKKLPIKFEV